MTVETMLRPNLAPEPGRPAAQAGPVSAEKVTSQELRSAALAVVGLVYGEEKGWISDAEAEIPESSLTAAGATWFLARVEGEPAGAVRLTYDPTLDLPQELGIELEAGVDLRRLKGAGSYVEIGRLMIAPRFRSRAAVVLALMRVALAEVVERGYTHLLTVVFEDDPHSPYEFHTRVLGFERIGTHRFGELACASRRIILTLDIAAAYQRMRGSRGKLLRQLTGGLEDRLEWLSRPRAV